VRRPAPRQSWRTDRRQRRCGETSVCGAELDVLRAQVAQAAATAHRALELARERTAERVPDAASRAADALDGELSE
jgi:hypothetical protein